MPTVVKIIIDKFSCQTQLFLKQSQLPKGFASEFDSYLQAKVITMHTKILQIVLFVGFACMPFGSLRGQDATMTMWKGTLEIPGGGKLRLEFDLIDNNGQQSGILRSLDQGNAEIKLNEVDLNEKSLSFKADQIGASYQGSLNNEKNRASGKFQQGALNVDMEIEKTGQKQVDAPEKELPYTLKEAWVGNLKLGVMEPVMQFRIVEKENGQMAAFFDSVTEGRTGFEAEHTITDETIEFRVPSIRLEFVGTLNEAKDTAEGNWTQAGRTFPLTLNKKKTEVKESTNR